MTDNNTLTSYNQVKIGKKPKVNVVGEETSDEESPICRLNDDCLINIFNHLTPEDRILMEQGII